METTEYMDAMAHLGEQVDELAVKQAKHHAQSWERLEQWSKTNESLTNCLREQSQANRESTGIYQALVQHLLTLAQTTQQLSVHTLTLDGSSKNLAEYLVEQQAPQLEKLEANSQQLQTSSSNLESYLKTEQSNRLKMLEDSLRTLLEMLEVEQRKRSSSQTATSSAMHTMRKQKKSQSPTPTQTEVIDSPPKKRSFNVSVDTLVTSAIASFISMALLVPLLSAVGMIVEPTRTVEAPEKNAVVESVEPVSDN